MIKYGYSSDTEILTNNGWKCHNKLLLNDLIGTFNVENRIIEFQNYKNYFENNYSGNMINIKNSATDLFVSENFKLLYRYSGARDEYINEIIYNVKLTNRTIFRIAGNPINKKDYPIEDNWLRLFAWINSDGSVRPNKGHTDLYVIYQREEKAHLIKKILDELGITYRINIRDRREINNICGIELKSKSKMQHEFNLNTQHTNIEHLVFIKKYITEKYKIPEILYKCSKRQVDIYLQSYIDGDGTRRPSGVNGSTIYGIKSMLDQIQILAIQNANSASLKNYRKNDWRINLVLNRYCTELSKTIKNSINYNGIIWCLSVENKNIITMRNGKVSIQGAYVE